jgi:hypothetical protein
VIIADKLAIDAKVQRTANSTEKATRRDDDDFQCRAMAEEQLLFHINDVSPYRFLSLLTL